jgi:hypothetical protein
MSLHDSTIQSQFAKFDFAKLCLTSNQFPVRTFDYQPILMEQHLTQSTDQDLAFAHTQLGCNTFVTSLQCVVRIDPICEDLP